MPLVCSNCNVRQWRSEFGRDRDKKSPVCRSCRRIRRRPNDQAKAVGKILCRLCGLVLSPEEFSPDRRNVDKKQGRCRQCMALHRRVKSRTLATRFRMAKWWAHRRKIRWRLSFDAWCALVSLPCHYCAGPLAETGVGLDRKDSSADYVLPNVVPCCWVCNTAKSYVFTEPEMKEFIGPAIAAIRAKRARLGEFPLVRGAVSRKKYPSPEHS